MAPFNVPIGSIIARIAQGYVDIGRDDLHAMLDALERSLPMWEVDHERERHGPGFDSFASRNRRLTTYLGNGGTMADLYEDDDECLASVQMLWEDVLKVWRGKTNATKQSLVEKWDGLDWFAIDAAVADGHRPTRELAREMRVGISTLQGVWRKYGRDH